MSDEKEKRIKELMRYSGLTRSGAELAVAIEAGEIAGDVEISDEPTPPINILDTSRS